ncbi:hypothetical protein BH24ACT5_BH24ACT5_08290 [soil metagenome]
MEWIETTGRSLEQAKEVALESLGILADDAEFEVLEEPRTGLFGRIRGEARIRARVRPATVRPKHDRRSRRKSDGDPVRSGTRGDSQSDDALSTSGVQPDGGPRREQSSGNGGNRRRTRGGNRGHNDTSGAAPSHQPTTTDSSTNGDSDMSNESHSNPTQSSADDGPPVSVDDVRAAAETFTNGLIDAFGLDGTSSSLVEGIEIEVAVDGDDDGMGLLIGPGGRTLLAIQDLARVAAQRRLGDHETRLRIDVSGYREKRRVALERFAQDQAGLVTESGVARSLAPMPSADRKVIHDTLTTIDGVSTRSEGEDPNRRIIISPA